MPSIKIEIDGMERFHRSVNSLADQIVNPPAKLMRRLGETAIEDIDKRFMTAGYGTWPPLAPSTVAKKHGNSFILIDTGAMFQSTRISGTEKDAVEVDVPYGGAKHNPKVPGYHQHGTGRTPQRKIIDVTPQLESALTDSLETWVIDMAKAFGKGM